MTSTATAPTSPNPLTETVSDSSDGPAFRIGSGGIKSRARPNRAIAYGISETGKVVAVAGTDSFAGMTGNISNHGTFVAGQGEPTADNPWLTISQMTGSVCMAQ